MGEHLTEHDKIENGEEMLMDESRLAVRRLQATPIKQPSIRDHTQPYPENNRVGGSRSRSRGELTIEAFLPEANPGLIGSEDEGLSD